MLRTEALDYELPPDLIATRPAEPRDACRLMVVSRSDDRFIEHRTFTDLPGRLAPADLVVFNNTRVLPARIRALREDTRGKVEGLYIDTAPGGAWRLMLRAGSRLIDGLTLRPLTRTGEPAHFTIRLEGRDGEYFLAAPQGEAAKAPAAELLSAIGQTPLPPYILRARELRADAQADDLDRDWYQCVYADPGQAASVAAPTAGLHFTPALLDSLAAKGVHRADLTLHVGPGTFKPVKTGHVEEHPIHAEPFEAPGPTIRALADARARAGRIIAVGTTAARALESLPPARDLSGHATSRSISGETRLLITPGYEWKWTDGLVTNFHLPRSTLLAMVAALFPRGIDRLKHIYAEAIRERYRFYSYGDAMLILP